jgi:uncharacterized protein YjeT (DUF2065 family)
VTLLALAFGVMLVFEGALYALFPGAMKKMMAQAMTQPDGVLRFGGLALAVLGFVLVWTIRG